MSNYPNHLRAYSLTRAARITGLPFLRLVAACEDQAIAHVRFHGVTRMTFQQMADAMERLPSYRPTVVRSRRSLLWAGGQVIAKDWLVRIDNWWYPRRPWRALSRE